MQFHIATSFVFTIFHTADIEDFEYMSDISVIMQKKMIYIIKKGVRVILDFYYCFQHNSMCS